MAGLAQTEHYRKALNMPRFGGQVQPIRRMLDAQKRQRDHLIGEFREVRGLRSLLMKRRNGSRWTDTERDALQRQLRALAHLSPYLVVLAVPGSFVVMPMLAWWLDRRRIRRSDHPPS